MATILDEIVVYKRDEVAGRKASAPEAQLRARLADCPPTRGFAEALAARAGDGPAVIAEIKRGSPSLGCIRPELDAPAQAAAYEAGGAAALSVLTDTHFFFARDDDFAMVRERVALPMLRKDFMIEPYQLLESRVMGADCVLLILAMLSDDQAARLADLAHELGMQVLAETHNAAEIERAVAAVDYDLLGINNRNLKTFETREETTLELAEAVPERARLVAESGLHSPDILGRYWREGIQRFLIGEAFVRSDDPESTVRAFVTQP